MSPTRAPLPLVAVVGRPNVGKSSLVNRILGRREAIVEETPGVTRDRRSFVASWRDRDFELMDTGGLEPGAEGLDARVAEQAHIAIEAADVVLFVVDGSAGAMQDDHEVAQLLRRAQKPTILVVNKVDDPRDEPAAAAFHRLGVGEPHPISALHGRGSGDMLDALVAILPAATGGAHDVWASIAIVGRPNVGKSSLLNALVGETRSIVDATPGTTRDPVDSELEWEDRRLRIVDTAGMRREVKVTDHLEYYSLLRSRRALERADVALLVIDAAEGVTGHDQRIAEQIVDAGRACVIALNKWDAITREETDRDRLERDIERQLRFLPWALRLRTSARTRRGVERILPGLAAATESHRYRVQTHEVNELVREAQLRRPHPRRDGRAIRVLYGVQAQVAPPTFLLFANGRLERAYVRYMERAIREVHPFAGSPVVVQGRAKTRPAVKG